MTYRTGIMEALRHRRLAQRHQALDCLDRSLETDTDRSLWLLNQAAPALGEPAVLRRWLELARLETRVPVLEAMVIRLARLDPRQLDPVDAVLDVLRHRRADVALLSVRFLARLAPGQPQALDDLVDIYQAYPDCRSRVLDVLGRVDKPPPRIASFLLSVLTSLDALALQRLTPSLTSEQLVALLDTAHPETLTLRVLDLLADRNYVDVEAMVRLVRSESREACRLAALRVLAQAPDRPGVHDALVALLGAMDSEPVFVAVVEALGRTQTADDASVRALVEALGRAPSVAMAQACLAALRRHLPGRPSTQEVLVQRLGGAIHHEVAEAICQALGPLLRDNQTLVERLLSVYQTCRDTAVQSAILEVLDTWSPPRHDWMGVYLSALAAPGQRLKNWAVRGFLSLPLDPEAAGRLPEAASALLDGHVDERLRRDLARMLTRLVDPPASLVEVFKQVVARESDADMRHCCREAVDRAPHEVDFDTWLRRVQVEHDVHGVFPDVYQAWDQNPGLAKDILRAAVLDLRTRPSFHPTRVNDIQMLTFLASKACIDDDLCRYCIDQCIAGSGTSTHLAILKSNPTWSGLMDGMRQLLAARSMRNWNAALLRELLVLGCGSDDTAGAWLRQRVEEADTPDAAFNPLHLATERAVFWRPALVVVEAAMRHRAVLDKTTTAMLSTFLSRIHRHDLVEALTAPRVQGPGLADDDE